MIVSLAGINTCFYLGTMVGINGEAAASRKNKVRVGVGQILILVLALVVVILISTARLIRQRSKVGHNNDAVSRQTSLGVPPPPGSSQHDAAGSSSKNVASEAKHSFHFIVSSDCTSYQRWETLTQLHSAQSVHQCGRFTWIVSGW